MAKRILSAAVAIALVIAFAVPSFAASAPVSAYQDSGVAAAATLPSMLSAPVVMAAADGTETTVTPQVYDFSSSVSVYGRPVGGGF